MLFLVERRCDLCNKQWINRSPGGRNSAGQLITANPRYRQLVDNFHALSLLDGEYVFLQGLKTETQQKVAEELRAAEKRVEELRQAQAGRHQEPPGNAPEAGTARSIPKASLGTP
jgi:hypothetical protein